MQTILFCVVKIKWGHEQVCEMENAVEGKGLRVNVDKQKVCSYYLEKKVVLRKWILVVSVVSEVVVILFGVRNVRGGFIVVVLMCLGR